MQSRSSRRHQTLGRNRNIDSNPQRTLKLKLVLGRILGRKHGNKRRWARFGVIWNKIKHRLLAPFILISLHGLHGAFHRIAQSMIAGLHSTAFYWSHHGSPECRALPEPRVQFPRSSADIDNLLQ